MEKVKKNKIHWSSPATWLLVISFFISLFTLVIYLEETDFSDETLFLLLTILRYSSFIVCICSFYKILLNIFRIFRDRQVNIAVNIISIIVFLFFFLYGLAIIFLETLIVVIAGGI